MNLDEYIAALEKLREQVGGNAKVMTTDFSSTVVGAAREASPPREAFIKIPAGRERLTKFYISCLDSDKGSVVVRI